MDMESSEDDSSSSSGARHRRKKSKDKRSKKEKKDKAHKVKKSKRSKSEKKQKSKDKEKERDRGPVQLSKVSLKAGTQWKHPSELILQWCIRSDQHVLPVHMPRVCDQAHGNVMLPQLKFICLAASGKR